MLCLSLVVAVVVVVVVVVYVCCFIIILIRGSTHAGAGVRRKHNVPISRCSVLQGRSNAQQGTNQNEVGRH